MRPMVSRLVSLCLTVLLAGTPLLAQEKPAAAAKPGTKTLTLTITDKATGEPVQGAKVTVGGGGRQTATSDEQGMVGLSVTGDQLSIRVSMNGYAGVGIAWNGERRVPVPSEFAIALEPGTTIGGFVKDEQGNGVSGASINLSSNDPQERLGELVGIVNGTVKTDKDGKWSLNTAPAEVPQFWHWTTHPDYFKDDVGRQVDVAAAKARNAVITMKKAAVVTGKVLDPDGKPVANAAITAGEEGWGGARHRAKTGADGTFTMKGLQPGSASLAVNAPGFAPQLVSTKVPNEAPVEVKVARGNPLELKVVDTEGKPIAGVAVGVEQWQNASYLEQKMTTNAEGIAKWDGAPPDEVQYTFSKKGLQYLRNKKITAPSAGAATKPVVVTMRPPTKVDGTVVDAATGQPIKEFRVTQGITWDEAGQNIHWWDEQNNNGDTAPKTFKDGKFSVGIGNYPYPFHVVRVEAAGYMPADSKFFNPEEGSVQFEFKLQKGKSIEGRLVSAGGKPIAGAEVFLVLPGKNMQINNGRVEEWARRQTTSTRTDADGKFTFTPQKDAFTLIAITEEGLARVDNEPGAAPKEGFELKAEPWGALEGTLMVGSKKGAGETLSLQVDAQNGGWRQDRPYVYMGFTAPADANGTFKFDRVPPGNVRVMRVIKLNENSTGYAQMTPAVVKAGQTASVSMGGSGRAVVGKLDLPTSLNNGDWIVWNTSVNASAPKPKAPPYPAELKTAEEKAKWAAEWVKTPEGAAYMRAALGFGKKGQPANGFSGSYAVKKDGTFRIDDVPAGDYTMTAQIYPGDVMRRGNWGNPLANVQYQFNVPEMAGGRSDEALDIGKVPVTLNANATPVK